MRFLNNEEISIVYSLVKLCYFTFKTH